MLKIILLSVILSSVKGTFYRIIIPLPSAYQIPPGHNLRLVHVALGSGDHGLVHPQQLLNLIPNATIRFSNPPSFSNGLDQLFKPAMQQAHQNGQLLSRTYSPFFGNSQPPFHPHIIQVRALNTSPAKNNVLSALRGLEGKPYSHDMLRPFPGDEEKHFAQQKPIVDDISRMHDSRSCPAFPKHFQNALNASGIMSRITPILNKFSSLFPEIENDPLKIPALHDLNKLNMYTGKKLPNLFSKKEGLMIMSMTKKIYQVGLSATPVKRLSAGRYISNLLDDIDKIKTQDASGKNPADPKKMVLFGSSSPMLKAIMSAMGGEQGYHPDSNSIDRKYPRNGAMFVVELLQKEVEQTYHVRLHFKQGDEPLSDKSILSLKECGDLCDFEKFKKLMQPMSLTKQQADNECKNA